MKKLNQDFFSLVDSHNWHKMIGIKKIHLKRLLVYAGRELFSESENHPFIKKIAEKQKITSVYIRFFFLANVLYVFNFIIMSLVDLLKVRWKPHNSEKKYYFLSPSGSTLDSNVKFCKKNKGGGAVCILGMGAGIKTLLKKRDPLLQFETLITRNPIIWLRCFWFFARQIQLVNSRLIFDSKNRSRVIARFFYMLLKQAVTTKKSREIESSIKLKLLFIFSYEELSLPFLHVLQEKNHYVSTQFHGMPIKGNLLFEPPLCNHLITSGERVEKIFESYFGIQVYNGGLVPQMLDTIRAINNFNDVSIIHDILIIASFELPFIQKSTYEILNKTFSSSNPELKVLLRHHPRVPIYSRNILDSYISCPIISKNKSLVEDISICSIVICCSVDALIVSLSMKKPTIFLPMIDGDYKYHLSSFINKLPNLWCPSSSQELVEIIKIASKFNQEELPHNYNEIVKYLCGDDGYNNLSMTINNLMDK